MRGLGYDKIIPLWYPIIAGLQEILTKKYPHVDNPRHEHDHPGGEKIDFSIYAKRGVLLGILFYTHGISHLQSADALSSIRLELVGYEIKVIPHAAHFDILVVKKL